MAHWNDSPLWRGMHSVLSNKWTTVVVVLCTALLSGVAIAEADALWQTQLGMDILNGGPIIAPDKYSWTASGTEYLSNSWLWNVLLALVYLAAGDWGIAGLGVLCVFAVAFFLVATLRAKGLPWWACTISLLVFSTFSRPWLNPRPQMADYVLIAFFIWLCVTKTKSMTGRIIPVLSGVGMVMLWNNLHLTGMVGAVLMAGIVFMTFTGITLLRRFAYALCMAILGLLACIVTPYGVEGLLKPLTTAGASMGIVSEWYSPWTFHDLPHFLSVGLILCFVPVAIWLLRGRRWLEATFIIGLIGVASYQNRWVPFLGLAGLLWLGEWLVAISPRIAPNVKKLTVFVLATVLLPSVAVSLLAFLPVSKVDNTEYGVETVRALPEGCKLLNAHEMGGPLILFRPDVKVSFDGRNDMYPAEEFYQQNHVMFGRDTDFSLAWIEDNGINCVLANEYTTIQGHLLPTGDWEVAMVDGTIELLLKK